MAHDGEQPYKESALSLPKEYGDASLPKYPSLTYEAILETSQRDETHIDAPNLLDSEIDDENDGSRNHLTEKWTTHWNDQYDKVYYYNWSTRKTSWKSPWDDELEVAFECDGDALAVNDHATRMTKHNDRQHCVEINNRATDDTNEIPNILNEKDNISPMAMASRRRIALLQKHRTRSKQPKGVVLVTTHTIIRTICTLCMMLLMSTRDKRLFSLQTDSCKAENPCKVSINRLSKHDILRTYFTAVVSIINLMILKPLYKIIPPTSVTDQG